MFPFARRIAGFVVLTLLFAAPARAQERISPPDLNVHSEILAVSINAADVSDGTTVYLANDGTVYVRQTDLANWGLRYPVEPALPEYDNAYGVQTQLNLAVSVDRAQERLEIIAPPTAFIGGPERIRQVATPGSGAFLNYRFNYQNATSFSPATTNGAYNLFFTQNASTLQVDYQSVYTSSGVALNRTLTRLYRLDVPGHRVLQLGEGSLMGGDVGNSTPYVGVHVASSFTGDPLFNTHQLPSVDGIATSPSVVQVFVNNILVVRLEVPEGPFTVRDLPASAAYSDVVLVLTDASGRTTTEVVRPIVDQDFLRPGLLSYNFDAGFQRMSTSAGSPIYGKALGSTTLRYGLTPWLTVQGMAESVEGNPFEALGFQIRPGFGQRATFWFGDGKLRRTGRLTYELRTGKLSFRDEIKYNAESVPYSFDDGTEERYEENAEATYNPSSELSLSLRLNRFLSSLGSTASMMTFESRLSLRNFNITLRPSYDKVRHVVSATLELTQRLRSIHEFRETLTRNAGQQYGATVSYQKTQRDQDDPWSWQVQGAEGVNQLRQLTVEDRMPWTNARIVASDQNGTGNINGELTGALAAAGLGINPLRTIEQEEVLGIVRLPGFPGVRIDVNNSPAGYTDNNGNLIVRRLASLQENVILADLTTIPLNVVVRDPLSIVPLPSTPVSVDLVAPKAQSVLVRIVDAAGKPLPPASRIVAEDGTEFPIGFDGRTFIRGLPAGSHTFSSSATSPTCSLQLRLEPRWEIVDAGTVTCK